MWVNLENPRRMVNICVDISIVCNHNQDGIPVVVSSWPDCHEVGMGQDAVIQPQELSRRFNVGEEATIWISGTAVSDIDAGLGLGLKDAKQRPDLNAGRRIDGDVLPGEAVRRPVKSTTT
jgi:hypothetical protein